MAIDRDNSSWTSFEPNQIKKMKGKEKEEKCDRLSVG